MRSIALGIYNKFSSLFATPLLIFFNYKFKQLLPKSSGKLSFPCHSLVIKIEIRYLHDYSGVARLGIFDRLKIKLHRPRTAKYTFIGYRAVELKASGEDIKRR